jgi:hypothetical protein
MKWKLVPAEITPDMKEAAMQYEYVCQGFYWEDLWYGILKKSPAANSKSESITKVEVVTYSDTVKCIVVYYIDTDTVPEFVADQIKKNPASEITVVEGIWFQTPELT